MTDKRLSIFFGTRPEYLKIKPLIYELRKNNFPFYLVQIFQHEDLEVSEKNEEYYVSINIQVVNTTDRLIALSAGIPLSIEYILNKSHTILVQGDTATVFLTALTAFHKKIKIVHLEAGLRTHDLQNPYPEEGYRQMISRIADIHLCPDSVAQNNLFKENIKENTFVVGNTILDLIKSYNLTPTLSNKVIITIHRRENWQQINSIFKCVIDLATQKQDLEFIWVLHPNPQLRNYLINYNDIPSNLIITTQKSHKEMAKMLSECYCVITDSGGLQEEATFLGKMCFVFRNKTERESISNVYLKLCKTTDELYNAFINTHIELQTPCKVYGTGNSSEKIVEILQMVFK